jgi:catechol 2,3-dioxygenase-like lactoylglutathione lyase family enzyme
MPIPPRVSVVAVRTVDLARSTAFYTALGWEVSAASTPAMSLFKTAGSMLLLCTDQLLTELGGDEVAPSSRASRTARRSCPSMSHRPRGHRRGPGGSRGRRGGRQAAHYHPAGWVLRVLRRP